MRRCLVLAAALLAACGNNDRKAGTRAPLTAQCDGLDTTRCALPWPSSTFTAADPSTATGIKLALSPRALPVHDSPAGLNRADGFSVATPLAAGFPVHVDPALDGQRAVTSFRLF